MCIFIFYTAKMLYNQGLEYQRTFYVLVNMDVSILVLNEEDILF